MYRFIEAEDGMRGAKGSRGIGEVNKRQQGGDAMCKVFISRGQFPSAANWGITE